MTETLTPEQTTEIIILMKDTVKMLTDQVIDLIKRVDALENNNQDYVG